MTSPTVWHIGSDDVRMRIPLLLALRQRGFSVGAVGSEDGRDFPQHGIPYFRYDLRRGLSPLGDLRAAAQLRALLRTHRPDIIHAFDTKPIILAPMLARRAGVPARVRTVTGMGYVFSSRSPLATALKPVYRTLQRWAGAAADKTVFQNPDDRGYFLQHNMVRRGSDALVPGSGIDTQSTLGELPTKAALSRLRHELELEGQLVVILISRLVKTKGVREYIDAARRIRQRKPNVTFLLVGPVTSEGRQAVSRQDLDKGAEFVRYLGQRNDVPALLALSHICVLPSYYREGIPRVLLEAAALGLPLITTDMPGCKEVVRHDWNGLLVPPRDANALAGAISCLLDSEDRRNEMGVCSKAHVQQFDLSHVADQYAELYRDILKNGEAVPTHQTRGIAHDRQNVLRT